MSGRLCLTPEQAFAVGFEEPCEHLVPDPNDCPKCRLSVSEIRRLVVLLHSGLATEAGARTTAA